jgi:AraC-like DNA-binding protein
MSFVKWRQQARLLAALALLADGQCVTDAALSVGYETPSAFIRFYRQRLGTTPGQAMRA